MEQPMHQEERPIIALPDLFQKYGQLTHQADGKLVFENKDYLLKKFRNTVKAYADHYGDLYIALRDWFPEDYTYKISIDEYRSIQEQATLTSLFNKVASIAEDQLPPVSPDILDKIQTEKTAEDAQPFFMQRSYVTPFRYDNSAPYQWYMCQLALKAAGFKIITNDALDLFHDARGQNLPIFTRDTAFILEDKAYILGFSQYLRRAQNSRQLRKQHIERFYQKQGFTTRHIRDWFGDGGDFVYDVTSTTLFIGIDRKRDAENIKHLHAIQNDFPDLNIVPIVRENYRLYHLDTMLSFLPNGEVIVNKTGFNDDDYKNLKTITAGRKIIPVPTECEDDPMTCNLVSSDNSVILSCENDYLKKEIDQCGYDVYSPHDFNLNHAQLHLGGLHCMTNQSLRYNP
jgi:N-dimethylarginine dimethylaminohydrolase